MHQRVVDGERVSEHPVVADVLAMVGGEEYDGLVEVHLIGKGTALGYGQGEWFLAIHIFTGPDRGDRSRHVPMVWGCHGHSIDVIAGQQVTEIIVAGLRVQTCYPASTFSVGGIDITYGHHLTAGLGSESFHI